MFRYSLEATNRRVDVVGEGGYVAIRVEPRPFEDNDTVMRVWLTEEHRLLPAGSYRTDGNPFAPSELSHWPVSLASGKHIHRGLYGRRARACKSILPALITTDMLALRAAMAGVGLVQLPVLMVKEQLAAGELVAVLEEWEPRRLFMLCSPSRRVITPSVRFALVDFFDRRVCADGGRSNLLVIHRQWTQKGRLNRPLSNRPSGREGTISDYGRQCGLCSGRTGVSSTVTLSPSGCGCSSYAFYRGYYCGNHVTVF